MRRSMTPGGMAKKALMARGTYRFGLMEGKNVLFD
jgi:hypothetical protein